MWESRQLPLKLTARQKSHGNPRITLFSVPLTHAAAGLPRKARFEIDLEHCPNCGGPATPADLASGQSLQLKLIHAVLDLYLIEGRPREHILAPPVPGRYSLRFQFEKGAGSIASDHLNGYFQRTP